MTELYNFDEEIDRNNSGSAKWNKYQGKDILPMWVADSDFAVLPEIQQALHARAEHPVFGYTDPPKSLVELLVQRMGERYDWDVDPSWIVFLPGIVGALFLACRGVGEPGDSVYLPEVVYSPFRTAPKLNNKVIKKIPMCWKDDRMVIDLDWLEQQAPRPGQLLLLCNPQNPGGAIYREDELTQLAEIAEARDLIICSDEIHCDLILDADKQHRPLASLNLQIENRSVTLMAPSKTFNLAGLGCAFAIVPKPGLRVKFKVNPYIVPHVNIMGYAAAEAAYRYGDEWIRQQCAYLASNRDLLLEEINRIPGLKMGSVEATYLAWIDVSALELDDPPVFFEDAGIGMSPGSEFGDRNFMRLNFACPRSRVEEAIRRIRLAVEALS